MLELRIEKKLTSRQHIALVKHKVCGKDFLHRLVLQAVHLGYFSTFAASQLFCVDLVVVRQRSGNTQN